MLTDAVARQAGRRRRIVRSLAGLLLLGCFAVVVGRQWSRVGSHLHELSWSTLVWCQLCTVASVLATMLAWRALLAGLGSPLHARTAARIYYVGQLGKYVPGSVWPLIVQMELGRDVGLPRPRVVLAGVLSLGVSVLTGSLLAIASLPWLNGVGGWRWAGPVVALLGLAACSSAWLFNRLVGLVLAPIRRLGRPTVTSLGLRLALAWSLAAWLFLGMQVYLLAREFGAHGARALPLAIGGAAAAVVIGILVVFAPAGAGARETAMVLTLAPLLAPSSAVLLAIVSRLQFAACDLLLAGTAVATARPRRARPGPPAPRDSPARRDAPASEGPPGR